MTDDNLRDLLLAYTQDAADAKEAVGASIMAQIEAAPNPELRAIRPRCVWPLRLAAAVAVFVLALSVFMQTPAGEAFAAYIYENLIQRFFQSEEVDMMIEGIPGEVSTLTPHGEITEGENEELASFVIYIDEDVYTVEQSDNLFMVSFEYQPHVMSPEEEAETREHYANDLGMSQEEIDEEIDRLKEAYLEPPDLPPVFMKITQVMDTTVEAEVDKHLTDETFSLTGTPTDEFPYTTLYYQGGQEWDSICIYIDILDNGCGGVFEITTQFFLEATEGHGSRLRQSLNTLEIIDPTQYD